MNCRQRRSRARRRRGTAPFHGPTVGLAVIVRNEARYLPGLLASVAGAFDHVVLVDNGSTDDTVSLFGDWCRRTGQRHRVAQFDWCDDYAAKRRFADSLLDTDWECWADGDDVIQGAGSIRDIVARAPSWAAALECLYDYAHDDTGRCTISYPHPRLVRRGRGTWIGRCHELKVIDGPVFPAPALRWVHQKTLSEQIEGERQRERMMLPYADEPWMRAHTVSEAAAERLQACYVTGMTAEADDEIGQMLRRRDELIAAELAATQTGCPG
jgi:glycosyltransferase involved in cell wall biosynthesis